MSDSIPRPVTVPGVMDRVIARWTTLGPSAREFATPPDPRSFGSFAKGRQLMAGNFMFAGALVEDSSGEIWSLATPDAAFEAEVQGFTWLDDLSAVADLRARELAQRWITGWIRRHGSGTGPGWTPDLTGRRLIRMIHHADFALHAQDDAARRAYMRSLSHQTRFLSRRWTSAAPGLPRFEALCALVCAALILSPAPARAAGAIRALEKECADRIDDTGGILSRNPEELLEIFTLLTWTHAALGDAGRAPSVPVSDAIARIAPTLRTLRHADGGLARFHGGGRGIEGQLDHALANCGIKHRHSDGLSMGYARLSGGRTSVIIDAAPPAEDDAGALIAHASTLAFELTSGRRPVVVNCGSGISFGIDWHRAGRATPSHSTLCLQGQSSARLGTKGRGRFEPLIDGAEHVPVRMTRADDGLRFQAGHDGYMPLTGLTHARTLELTSDGRAMAGEDLLIAIEEDHKRRFDSYTNLSKPGGIPFQIRFHLHPDVEAQLDLGGVAVSLALKSGELWVFRHDGSGELRLEPSVFLEKNRLKPRATTQIVLSSLAKDHATRVRWSLSKAQDTPVSIRDLNRDGMDVAL
ncbi:heparinase II/III family protein [Pseudooceanicola nitratireducens]|uniref:heparinase II/III family protein n=1 Tax=Pseudooceanicola nitratireducens TaxID=517719 RepID=UPI0036F29618